jgi:hypothetical protein
MRLGVFLITALIIGTIGWTAFDAFKSVLAEINLSTSSLNERFEKLEQRDSYINERIDTLYELRRN